MHQGGFSCRQARSQAGRQAGGKAVAHQPLMEKRGLSSTSTCDKWVLGIFRILACLSTRTQACSEQRAACYVTAAEYEPTSCTLWKLRPGCTTNMANNVF